MVFLGGLFRFFFYAEGLVFGLEDLGLVSVIEHGLIEDSAVLHIFTALFGFLF